MLIFFDINKVFILAGQTVSLPTTEFFYGECVKMCEDFFPNFGNETTAYFITTTHRLIFFTPENFYQKQHDCGSPTALPFSAFPIEDKTEDRHFDTIEVI
jgi:hypothetical protein